jgi:pimeloyl-ACP methyl ester carboxylesterase
MDTYVLIHGGGGGAWIWGLLAGELRARGHDVVAVDLPIEDDLAGLNEYAETVVEAIGDRTDLVVVAHSLGAFTGPLVCVRVPVEMLVLVAGMVPLPGETGMEWWVNTGHEQEAREQDEHDDGEITVFYHDVPPALAAEAVAKGRDQASTPMLEPWPLRRWPDVPTRYLLCRDDRMFPPEFARRVVRERLGITPDEIDSGHCPMLGRPQELADRLVAYRAEL